jgi:hypothetical protein
MTAFAGATATRVEAATAPMAMIFLRFTTRLPEIFPDTSCDDYRERWLEAFSDSIARSVPTPEKDVTFRKIKINYLVIS